MTQPSDPNQPNPQPPQQFPSAYPQQEPSAGYGQGYPPMYGQPPVGYGGYPQPGGGGGRKRGTLAGVLSLIVAGLILLITAINGGYLFTEAAVEEVRSTQDFNEADLPPGWTVETITQITGGCIIGCGLLFVLLYVMIGIFCFKGSRAWAITGLVVTSLLALIQLVGIVVSAASGQLVAAVISVLFLVGLGVLIFAYTRLLGGNNDDDGGWGPYGYGQPYGYPQQPQQPWRQQ